jgi:hypothetical protein
MGEAARASMPILGRGGSAMPRRLLITLAVSLGLMALLGWTSSSGAAVGPCNVQSWDPFEPHAPPAFAVPPRGFLETHPTDAGQTCIIRRGDATRYAQAWTNTIGKPDRIDFFDAQGRRTEEINGEFKGNGTEYGGGNDGGGSNRCVTATNNPESVHWGFSPIGWYLNKASLPAYLDKNWSESSVIAAHDEWEYNNNWCALADNSALNFTYNGTTSRVAGQDTWNVVDYGEVAGNPMYCDSTSIACEHTWFSTLTGDVIEADIRLDNDYFWTNDIFSYPSRFDIWNVMAHEVGHKALFGHVNDSTQAMYMYSAPGSDRKTLLSRGDAQANNSKY